LGEVRQTIPTAWRLLLNECRAGHRRWAGTQTGENYQTVLALFGEGDYSTPRIYERTMGDLIDPTRPHTTTNVVNIVSSEISGDAASWRFDRLLDMVATVDKRGTKPDDLD